MNDLQNETMIPQKNKRKIEEEYPSPVQEKKLCLHERQFELEIPITDFGTKARKSPLSPAFPRPKLAVALPELPKKLPHKLPAGPVTKKGLKKEPSTPLPAKLLSDNGKRSWELFRSIGKGGCGEVYLARENTVVNSGEVASSHVAVKIIKDRKQFQSELNTMKTLHGHRFGRGYTPRLITAVRKKKTLVMEYLSETVAARFDKCFHKFSIKTICMLALNMMTLVRDFNEKTGQAHVDIKPSNICTSSSGKDLYLIDFGYSTSPLIKLPGQTGTPLFMACSLQTIGAAFPSFLDDFESIGYVIMFFIAGGKKGLPWGGLRTHKEIAAAKNDRAIHEFCSNLAGTEYEPIAQTLATFLYVTRDRSQPFTDMDYGNLYGVWETALNCLGFENDKIYDWVEYEDSSLTLLNSIDVKQKML